MEALKKALEDSIKHWEFMTSGEEYKRRYFIINKIDIPFAACYACEYDELFEGNCSHCPLRGYAWPDACSNENSLYSKWRRACGEEGKKDRIFYATQMVNACKAALYDLEVNNVQ